MNGNNFFEEAKNFYNKALEIGFDKNSISGAIISNNMTCLKWWEFFKKVEDVVLKLQELSKELNISDHKVYDERMKLEENLNFLKTNSKEIHDEIVLNFKKTMNLLECKTKLMKFLINHVS